MPSNKPVIFLAFANDRIDQTRYLRQLNNEQQMLRKVLLQAQEAGICEIVERSNASIDDIFDVFQKKYWQDRIAIFHYGGHANSFELLLEQQQVAHSEALTDFLGKQKALQFVFLNGCSTQQHALQLTQKGVSAVIASSQSIDDELASKLASRFYEGIANGLSLGRSWQEAKFSIQTLVGKDLKKYYYKEVNSERFPWDFWLAEGAENIQDWNLPDAADDVLFGLPPIILPKNLPEEPYLFLKSYEREHAALFFGRASYIRQLYQKINSPQTPPLILLYGQSGVGKSSFLEAGIFPRLENEFAVFYIRRNYTKGLLETIKEVLMKEFIEIPLAQIYEKEKDFSIDMLQSVLKNHTHLKPEIELIMQKIAEKELNSLANTEIKPEIALSILWKKIEESYKKPLILLLDQVEETFTMPFSKNGDEWAIFLENIKELFREDIKGKIILSYKKEHHAEILKKIHYFQIPKSELFLEPFKHSEIVEIVEGIAKNPDLAHFYKLSIDKHLPSMIADDLSSDKNSPIATILQIILTKLWYKAKKSAINKIHIDIDSYNSLKNKGFGMESFFVQQLNRLHEGFAEEIESGLILDILYLHCSEWSSANTISPYYLEQSYSHCIEKVKNIIEKLKEVYIIINEKNNTRLVHDTLAPIVLQHFNQSYLIGQRARRILVNKTENFVRNNSIFLDEYDLEIVEKAANSMRFWTKNEIDLIEKSRKERLKKLKNRRIVKISFGLLASFVFLALGTVVLLWQESQNKAFVNYLLLKAQDYGQTNSTLAIRASEIAWQNAPNNIGLLKFLGETYSQSHFYQKNFWHKHEVKNSRFNENNTIFLSTSTDLFIRIWNKNGSLIDVIEAEDEIVDIRFLEGNQFAYLTKNRFFIICDTKGNILKKILLENTASIFDYSKNKKMFLFGFTNGKAYLYDQKMTFIRSFEHKDWVDAVKFSSKGEYILTGSYDNTAILWDLTGKKISVFNEDNHVLCFDFYADNKLVVIGNNEGNIKLWKNTGEFVRNIGKHKSEVVGIKFLDDNRILSASTDQTMRIWDFEGKELSVLKGHHNRINEIDYIPENQLLISCSDDNTVKLWQLDSKQKFEKIPYYHTNYFLYFNKKNEKIVVSDSSIQFLDSKSKSINKINFNFLIHIFAQNNVGKMAVSNKDSIFILDNLGKIKNKWKAHQAEITSLSFSKEALLLSTSKDYTAKLWDINGKLLTQIHHNSQVTAGNFSPENQIVTGNWIGQIKFSNLNGKLVSSFRGHLSKINSLHFSNSGNLISASEDHTAKLWDKENQLKNIFYGHQEGVKKAIFSLDAQFILTLGNDGLTQVFDSKNRFLYAFSSKNVAIDASFSPNSDYLFLLGKEKVHYFYLLHAFLKTEKIAKLSPIEKIDMDLQVDFNTIIDSKNPENIREAIYFYEKKYKKKYFKSTKSTNLEKAALLADELLKISSLSADLSECGSVFMLYAKNLLENKDFENAKLWAEKAFVLKQKNLMQELRIILILSYLFDNQLDKATKIYMSSSENLLKTEFFRKIDEHAQDIDHRQKVLLLKFYTIVFGEWLSSTKRNELESYAIFLTELIEKTNENDFSRKSIFWKNTTFFIEKSLKIHISKQLQKELVLANSQWAWNELLEKNTDIAEEIILNYQKNHIISPKHQKLLLYIALIKKDLEKARELYKNLRVSEEELNQDWEWLKNVGLIQESQKFPF